MGDWLLEGPMDILEFKAAKDGNNCPLKARNIGGSKAKDSNPVRGKSFPSLSTLGKLGGKAATQVLELRITGTSAS